VEGASAAPHFLAHFNLPSRILFERHEMLVDSNLDWGQDLGRLKEWMDREGIPSLKLSYFGHGSPRQLLLQHEVLPGNCTYPFFEPEWKQAGPLKPGDIVAISASNYSGFLLQDRDLYRRQFAGVKPLAVIGNSIIVFRVPVRIR